MRAWVISITFGVLVFTGLAAANHFNPVMIPEKEVALLAMADYEIPVSECWRDIGGYKSFICEVEIDHPQLGDLWCFTVEQWDGDRPTEVLLSRSGYDCDYQAVNDTLQNRY